ncbi:hypothetical protein M407DRAFT_216722 [Tulasnella calospora MUT 4182]|uniref:GED domain-containing protein n=1 Tax=Tulasnella calospora MUT 4182 TaxID=1051891 RepID=A0A0C3QCJ0_9AGAM|nr:hypothetical protein M407DRAFT_216722 [Tulasnella calospora MUT 4182]
MARPRSWSPPPSSTGGHVEGTPDDATLGQYAERSHALLDILKDLHSTGIQNELDLPKIVVIGSQSVGKSSLIESMSGIALPRNSGTCTRCPMECRLQYAPSWSCQVVLRFQYDAHGKARTEMKEVPFGEIIYDKSEVTTRLERAQHAILNPNIAPESILKGDVRPNSDTLTFSANCVCVRVAGPNVPDLYFYDLPGVIANVSDGGKERDIELVDKLATSYVSRPNCLVLLVITCDTDFENQKAGRLVLKSKDRTLKERTVGVLTKVDRIQPCDEERWLQILRGDELVLRNGWYCVKQRGPKELEAGVTWEEAKVQEQNFFSTETPWCDLEGSLSGRVGSKALSVKLGNILSDLVSKELPTIQTQVIQHLSEAKIALAKFAPVNTEQPQTEVIRLLQEFARTLAKHIDGVPPSLASFDSLEEDPTDTASTGLMNALNNSYDRFRQRIRDTAPQFRPWSSSIEAKQEELDLMADMKLDDDPLGVPGARVFYLDQVMNMAQKELPGNFPFSVKEVLISRSTTQWRDIAAQSFQEVWDHLVNHANRLIDIHFGRYSRGGLKDDVQRVIVGHMKGLAKNAMEKVEGLCQTEESPYTQNDHYFFDYRTKLLLRYKAAHRQSKSQSSVIQSLQDHDSSWKPQRNSDEAHWQNINEVLSGLATIGIPGIVATDLIKLLPDDNMGPAFEIMAEVRAYFQVAYKRFSDNIPKQIDNDFVRGITKDLNVVLFSQMINSLTPTKCYEYLEEPAEVIQRRKELEARIKRLQAAKDRLLEFNRAQDRGFLRASYHL